MWYHLPRLGLNFTLITLSDQTPLDSKNLAIERKENPEVLPGITIDLNVNIVNQKNSILQTIHIVIADVIQGCKRGTINWKLTNLFVDFRHGQAIDDDNYFWRQSIYP